MSTPQPQSNSVPGASTKVQLRTIAIRVAIGSLIAAALLCAIWVLFGGQNGIITRALLTIVLFAAFAGVALFDARAADRRPQWYALASMISWVVILIAGAIKIWMPWQYSMDSYMWWSDNVGTRIFELLVIALVVRLALLHTRIFLRAHERYVTTFTRTLTIVTSALVWVLALMLVLPMLLSQVDFGDFYWRAVVAITILAALGSALIPLLNAINAPRKQQPVAPQYYATAPQQYGGQQYPVQQYAAPQVAYAEQGQQYAAPQPTWPTYVDGVTPLPVMPDGSPDYNAYYTGYPTYPAPTGAPTGVPTDAPTGAPEVPAQYQAPYQAPPVPPVAPPV